jgi:trigger factor
MSYINDMTVERDADTSTVTVTGEIPYEELAKHRSAALEKLGADVEVDGFRKGHVPEDMLIEQIGEMNLLSEMAERALAATYPSILETHEIDAVGYPQINVTKLAADNPFGFTATIAVVPQFDLPNYHEVAQAHRTSTDDTTVTDEDIDSAVKDILRRKVAYERIQRKAARNAESQSDTTDLPTPETVAQNETQDESNEEPTDDELPELTDEVVKEIGDFSDVAAFKAKVQEELAEQKTQEAKNKQRAAITDALVEATTITVPAVLVDAELEQIMAQMQEDLKQAQLSFEDYLSHLKKTEQELKDEWRPSAEKRAKVQLILDAIADAESLTPDENAVNDQITALKQQYPDADEARIRTYVTSILRNDAVMKLLEGTDNTVEETTETS